MKTATRAAMAFAVCAAIYLLAIWQRPEKDATTAVVVEGSSSSEPAPITLSSPSAPDAKQPVDQQPPPNVDKADLLRALLAAKERSHPTQEDTIATDGGLHAAEEAAVATEAQLHERFLNEASDAAWTRDAREYLEDTLRLAEIPTTRIASIDCRTTLCNVRLELQPTDELAKLAELRDPETELRSFFSGSALVLYFARQNQALK